MERPPVQRTLFSGLWCETTHGQTFPRIQEGAHINFRSSTHFKKWQPELHRKGSIMPSPVLFGISVTFGLAAWGAVAWHYIWPALRERPSPENLKPILLLHGFRFLGLAFVVSGLVSPDLPATFAQPPAYAALV